MFIATHLFLSSELPSSHPKWQFPSPLSILPAQLGHFVTLPSNLTSLYTFLIVISIWFLFALIISAVSFTVYISFSTVSIFAITFLKAIRVSYANCNIKFRLSITLFVRCVLMPLRFQALIYLPKFLYESSPIFAKSLVI